MPSISEECPHYGDACDLASRDDEFFSTFKRNNFYRAVLEHVSEEQGQMYYDEIDENSLMKKEIHKFSINDFYGLPIVHDFEFGTFSPTTLRYAKVLNDISKLVDINDSSIAEIGAGYGGQYLVTRQLFKPKRYSFFDIDPAIRLIKKYTRISRSDDIDLDFYVSNSSIEMKNYDLVISNYAISECEKDIQDYYISNVIAGSKRGYITFNHMRGYSIDDFITRLKDLGKVPSVGEENPQTSPPGSRKNLIITW